MTTQCQHGNFIGYCAECGKKAIITCQRCDGKGEIDMDESGMVSCPVCDGACTIDYEMVADYAKQIDYYVGECAKKNAEVIRLKRGLTNPSAMLSVLDRIQPHLRHIPDVTHTEIEILRKELREYGYIA